MEPRSVLKFLRKFAARELREKKADHICIRRVKMESTLRRGWLPDLIVREVRGVHYLVCVFRGDALRVYYMDKGGESLGASEFIGGEKDKMWEDIREGTRNVFCLPTRCHFP
jgi:hypothetical protein